MLFPVLSSTTVSEGHDMMARRGFLGVLAGSAAALVGGCGLFAGNSYRFRMTVEVETPEGLKTGSSVYQVEAKDQLALTPGGVGQTWNVRGEAVAVDLPGGKTLFALLKTVNTAGHDDFAYMSMRALDPAFNYNRVESANRISSGDVTSPSDVPASDYPLLVTFGDLNDPTSVVRVAPANLAAQFGPNVRLRRITVEVTDDAVTTGIEKRLGWLRAHVGTLVRRERNTHIGDMPVEHRLLVTDFEMGASK
ncbi:MAG: hypothetical protein CVT85_06470 [Alphaproteobacteria bacterium HGW-Alphaproteobacteria-7]|jgi:hypothetical protein|nr:MAG: hypothetical protein CVT85_06470 [Alphaproteobacteria bacterium HGW-Alphaproteobacteria-7]